MPWYQCPQGHWFPARELQLSPQQIARRCSNCHRDDALLFLDNLALEFEGARLVTNELFYDGQPLYNLYQRVLATGLAQSAQLQCRFERLPPPTRQGLVLAFVAQAIRNHCTRFVYDAFDHEPNIVVVATLICNDQGAPCFVIGLNGNAAEHPYLEHFESEVPERIHGIPCVVVAEAIDPPQKTIDKRLSDLGDVSAWSWHGEQKVLRWIKTARGITSRLTATCMGIAHCHGPCVEETAGAGTNYCYLYLNTKFDKDQAQIAIGGIASRTVSAYWYANMRASFQASLESLDQ